jgi:ribosomal-protein-serine acetyltransferase
MRRPGEQFNSGELLSPGERLDGGNVTLRRMGIADADDVYALVTASLRHLRPWLEFAAGDYRRADAVRHARRCEADWEHGTSFTYLIILDEGELAGRCGLNARIGPGGLDIGYWLSPAHTGRGIATAAVAILTTEAFRIGADRVEIAHDAANRRSGAVPRRLGFTEVGRRPPPTPNRLPGEIGVEVVWRKVRPGPGPGRRHPNRSG